MSQAAKKSPEKKSGKAESPKKKVNEEKENVDDLEKEVAG